MPNESPPPQGDRVYLAVGEDVFDDFTDYTVSSHLLKGASGFRFSTPWRTDSNGIADIKTLEQRGLVAGATTRLFIQTGGVRRLQMTGKIETVETHTDRAGGSVIILEGQDHLGPLVNGDALPSIGGKNPSFRDVIFQQLAPYGFGSASVVVDGDASRALLTGKPAAGTTLSKDAPIVLEDLKLEKAHAQSGETVFSFLERHARRFGLLVWGTPDGKIVFGRPNYEQKPLYSFLCRVGPAGTSNNVEVLARKTSVMHRPSEIHVYGHSASRDFALSDVHEIVYDDYVRSCGIYSPLVIHDNNAKTKEQARQRALYEMGVRRQHGDVCSFKMMGHQAEDGAIYSIDTIGDVQWDAGGVHEARYVISRTFTRSKGTGTHTQVELVPKYSLVLGDPKVVPPAKVSKLSALKKLTPVEQAIATLAGGTKLKTES